jgi:hypothetical protein
MNIHSLMLAHFTGRFFHGHGGVGPLGFFLFLATMAILIWVIATPADRPVNDAKPEPPGAAPPPPQ